MLHLARMLLLLALQVLIFNHIHILGYARARPDLYFLLTLPAATPRWLYLLSGFLLGAVVDLFTGTLGPAAASATLLALIAPPALRLFIPPDQRDQPLTPSATTLRWRPFLRYAALLTAIHHTLYFLLENFSLLHPTDLLYNILGSTALTLLLLAAIERLRQSFRPRPASS